MQRIW